MVVGIYGKLHAPLNSKLTLWLALNNKLLTWDNLIKHGWQGPAITFYVNLAQKALPTLLYPVHLQCRLHTGFSELHITRTCASASLVNCLKSWLENKGVSSFKGFASILINCIWWARDTAIFNSRFIPTEITNGLVTRLCMEHNLDPKFLQRHIPIMPPLLWILHRGILTALHKAICHTEMLVLFYFSLNHTAYRSDIHLGKEPTTGLSNCTLCRTTHCIREKCKEITDDGQIQTSHKLGKQ